MTTEKTINLFQIETGVEITRKNKNHEKTKLVIFKIVTALNNMRDGQSLVFDGISDYTLSRHFKKEFPEMKFKISLVDKEKKWFRFFLVKRDINVVEMPKEKRQAY